MILWPLEGLTALEIFHALVVTVVLTVSATSLIACAVIIILAVRDMLPEWREKRCRARHDT